jgi:hypothetical protein
MKLGQIVLFILTTYMVHETSETVFKKKTINLNDYTLTIKNEPSPKTYGLIIYDKASFRHCVFLLEFKKENVEATLAPSPDTNNNTHKDITPDDIIFDDSFTKKKTLEQQLTNESSLKVKLNDGRLSLIKLSKSLIKLEYCFYWEPEFTDKIIISKDNKGRKVRDIIPKEKFKLVCVEMPFKITKLCHLQRVKRLYLTIKANELQTKSEYVDNIKDILKHDDKQTATKLVSILYEKYFYEIYPLLMKLLGKSKQIKNNSDFDRQFLDTIELKIKKIETRLNFNKEMLQNEEQQFDILELELKHDLLINETIVKNDLVNNGVGSSQVNNRKRFSFAPITKDKREKIKKEKKSNTFENLSNFFNKNKNI